MANRVQCSSETTKSSWAMSCVRSQIGIHVIRESSIYASVNTLLIVYISSILHLLPHVGPPIRQSLANGGLQGFGGRSIVVDAVWDPPCLSVFSHIHLRDN
jgi:hypothetical protein